MMSRSSSPAAPWPVTLRSGAVYAKVRPWSQDLSVAQLTLITCPALPPTPTIRVWLHELRAHGFASVRFGAVPEAMADVLERQGFDPIQYLKLLDMSLIGWSAPSLPSLRTQRLRFTDWPQAQRVDLAAFGDEWALDETGIGESCRATPHHRARMIALACDNSATANSLSVSGYAISGRADKEGFLQRLAVHPHLQGRGIGSALVADSLRWMKRHRATRAVVNTHVENVTAIHLYRQFGFRTLPHGLVLLQRSLDDLS